MPESDQNQINILESSNNSEKEKPENSKIQEKSSDTWLASMVSILGQISSHYQRSQSRSERGSDSTSSTFSEKPLVASLEFLTLQALHQMIHTLESTNRISEKDLPDLLSIVQNGAQFKSLLQNLNQAALDLLDLLDLAQFSYCPQCNTLEKTLEFQLCDQCHSNLVKGNDIRIFLVDQLFSREIPLPMEILQILHQRFNAKVREISYELEGKTHYRQLIDIPDDMDLKADRMYSFLVIDSSKKLVPLTMSEKSSNHPASESVDTKTHSSAQSTPEVCRNCGATMQFLRTTIYYETNCDLYKCPDCGMEKMTHFQPIWESGIEDRD